jgi:hypothetical protein
MNPILLLIFQLFNGLEPPMKQTGRLSFLEQPAARLVKTVDPKLGPIVTYNGASFPSTTLSEKNIDVIAAWKRIVADPSFQVLTLLPLGGFIALR